MTFPKFGGVRTGLDYHEIEEHGKGRCFPCSHCDQVFELESELTSHSEHKHPEEGVTMPLNHVYNCSICPQREGRPEDIIKHKRFDHEKHFFLACDHCDFRSDNASTLGIHVKLVHEQSEFKCPHCDKGFKREENRRKHVRKSHPDAASKKVSFKELGPVTCEKCNRTFRSICNFKTHIRTVHIWPIGEGTKTAYFHCDICNENFGDSEMPRDHVLNKHIKTLANTLP